MSSISRSTPSFVRQNISMLPKNVYNIEFLVFKLNSGG